MRRKDTWTVPGDVCPAPDVLHNYGMPASTNPQLQNARVFMTSWEDCQRFLSQHGGTPNPFRLQNS